MSKNLKLDRQQIVDLLVTALEGGSNYWYAILRLPELLTEGLDTEAKIEAIMDNPSLSVRIFDAEDLSEHLGELNAKTIAVGVNAFKREYPDAFMEVLNESWDADTADILFQLIIMGDVVYG